MSLPCGHGYKQDSARSSSDGAGSNVCLRVAPPSSLRTLLDYFLFRTPPDAFSDVPAAEIRTSLWIPWMSYRTIVATTTTTCGDIVHLSQLWCQCNSGDSLTLCSQPLPPSVSRPVRGARSRYSSGRWHSTGTLCCLRVGCVSATVYNFVGASVWQFCTVGWERVALSLPCERWLLVGPYECSCMRSPLLPVPRGCGFSRTTATFEDLLGTKVALTAAKASVTASAAGPGTQIPGIYSRTIPLHKRSGCWRLREEWAVSLQRQEKLWPNALFGSRIGLWLQRNRVPGFLPKILKSQVQVSMRILQPNDMFWHMVRWFNQKLPGFQKPTFAMEVDVDHPAHILRIRPNRQGGPCWKVSANRTDGGVATVDSVSGGFATVKLHATTTARDGATGTVVLQCRVCWLQTPLMTGNMHLNDAPFWSQVDKYGFGRFARAKLHVVRDSQFHSTASGVWSKIALARRVALSLERARTKTLFSTDVLSRVLPFTFSPLPGKRFRVLVQAKLTSTKTFCFSLGHCDHGVDSTRHFDPMETDLFDFFRQEWRFHRGETLCPVYRTQFGSWFSTNQDFYSEMAKKNLVMERLTAGK